MTSLDCKISKCDAEVTSITVRWEMRLDQSSEFPGNELAFISWAQMSTEPPELKDRAKSANSWIWRSNFTEVNWDHNSLLSSALYPLDSSIPGLIAFKVESGRCTRPVGSQRSERINRFFVRSSKGSIGAEMTESNKIRVGPWAWSLKSLTSSKAT